MDVQTERWLGPLITALLATATGGPTFQRFMQAAVTAATHDATPGVDWIRIGQMIRDELHLDHYPREPPRRVLTVIAGVGSSNVVRQSARRQRELRART